MRRVVTVAVAAAALLSACGSRVPRALREEARTPAALEHAHARPPAPATTPATAGTASPAASAPAPPAPVPESAALASVPPLATSPPALPRRQGRWALLVGIDDYAGAEHDLTGAVADVRTTLGALRALGVPRDHVRVLTNDGASAHAIRDGLGWLARRSRPGSLGVFLYAGHAVQVAGDPDSDGEAIDEAVLGSDMGLVTDGEIARALGAARGAMWLLFASCNAAGFADAAAPGRVLSYASGEEDDAYESRSLGGSFLVEFVVRRAILEGGVRAVEAAHRHAAGAMTGGWVRHRPLLEDRHRGPLLLRA